MRRAKCASLWIVLPFSACLFAANPAVGAGPSFSCAKAETADEKAICASPELSELDTLVAAGYAHVRATLGAERARSMGIAALKARRACGGNRTCIRSRQVETIEAYRRLGAPLSVPEWVNPGLAMGSSDVPAGTADVTQGVGPSFSCAKAETADEKAICASPELSELDTLVAAGYAHVRATLGAERARSMGIAALKARRACGANKVCIQSRQVEAIDSFSSLGAPITIPAWAGGGRATASSDTPAGQSNQCAAKFSPAELFWSRLGFGLESCTREGWFILRGSRGESEESCVLLSPGLSFSYRRQLSLYGGVDFVTVSALGFHRLVPQVAGRLVVPDEGFEIDENSAASLDLWVDRDAVGLQAADSFLMLEASKQQAFSILITNTPESLDQQLADGHALALKLRVGESENLWIFGLTGSREALTWMKSCAGMGE